MTSWGDIGGVGGSGVLGNPGSRARQIATVGGNQGKFMASDLIELCLDAMTNMGSSVGNYREDLGNRVQRYLVVEDRDDEDGTLEVEVRFTSWREPDKRFRIRIGIEELEV